MVSRMVSRITDSHYGGGVLCKEYLLNVTYIHVVIPNYNYNTP